MTKKWQRPFFTKEPPPQQQICGTSQLDFVGFLLNLKDLGSITCEAICIEAPTPDFVKVWYELKSGNKVLLTDWIQTNWKRPDELNHPQNTPMTPVDRVNFVKEVVMRHMSNRVEMTRAAASGDMQALLGHLEAGDLVVR